MTPQETILLDTIKTHLPLNIKMRTNLSISLDDSFSKSFTAAIDEFLSESHPSINRGGLYDLILINQSTHQHTRGYFVKLKSILTSDGIMAFCANNTSVVQKPLANRLIDIENNKQIETLGLQVLFHEPAGKLNYIHNKEKVAPVPSPLNKLPNTKFYSPFIVLLLQNTEDGAAIAPYQSANSPSARLKRIHQRLSYTIRNHKINDYLIATQNLWKAFTSFVKRILFIYKFRYKHHIQPTITALPKDRKYSVFITMTYLQTGGVERVILNLIKGLDKSLFNIHLITTVESNHEWHDIFSPHVDSITHIATIFDKHWPLKYRQRYLADLTGRSQPDTLFITNSEAAYFALPTITKTSPGTRVYDLLHTHGTPRDKDAYLRISMPFDKYIDRRIVISEYLKEYYCKHYPVNPDKIDVIYNSLDSETLSFNLSNQSKDAFFESIPDNMKTFTFVGRLEFDKSPQRLVTLARRIKEEGLNGHIVVVGDGTLGSEMKLQAEQDGTLGSHISFYGLSTTPLAQMLLSDFTLLVSNAEGIPMSVLESMSVNTPAISSAVGGVPEIISDGIDGILVDISTESEDEKIDHFVSGIKKAINLSNQQYNTMAQAARKKVDKKFSSMEKAYQSIFLTGSLPSKDKVDRG